MRRGAFISGLFLLAAAWLGPLPKLAEGAFFAHMIMHMLVVAVAAPLLAFGIAGSGYDPVRRFPGYFAPIPASFLELVVVWGWHAPMLHHLARNTNGGLVAEQGSFLFTGLLVWLSVLAGGASGNRSGAGVAALLLTCMHMTLLGALLALTPRPLYDHAHGAMGLSALGDQQLGGAIMILVGAVSYLAGGLWLMLRLLRTRPINARVSA